jgi:predicted transcriptional regulator
LSKSVVLSVRIPEEVKKSIEELGYEPTRFAKDAILDAIERERAKRSLTWIRGHMLTMEEGVTEIIRHDRNNR